MRRKPEKVGIYARVSTEDQAEKGYSLEGQVASCRSKALELGYKPEELLIFTDDVSGTLADRPGLNALREWSRGVSRPELVLVYDPDRLARKLSLQLMLTDEWLKRGIRLEFVNFEWTNTAEGRMFYQLRGMFAEFEREKIRERTIRGKLTKLKNTGKLSLDPRLFGYRFDTERDVLVVEPAAAETVKRIFRLAAGGLSGEEIARNLARDGVPAPRGNRWHGSTVTRILHNRSYLGEYKAYKTDYHQGFKRKRPESEQFLVPIEPLVEEELFQEAQRTLQRSRTRSGRSAVKEVLLSGLARCSCGRSMVSGGASSSRNYSYYICSSKLKASYPVTVEAQKEQGGELPLNESCGSGCLNGYWNSRTTDEAVWGEIVRFLTERSPFWVPFMYEERKGMDFSHTLASGKLADTESKLSKLLELYLSDGISRALYDEKKAALEAEALLWKEKLQEAGSLEASGGPAASSFAGTTGDTLSALQQLSFGLRRRIVRLILEQAVFHEGPERRLQLVFRLSGNPCDGQSHGGL